MDEAEGTTYVPTPQDIRNWIRNDLNILQGAIMTIPGEGRGSLLHAIDNTRKNVNELMNRLEKGGAE